jgi:hypothetical protein
MKLAGFLLGAMALGTLQYAAVSARADDQSSGAQQAGKPEKIKYGTEESAPPRQGQSQG